MASLLRRALGHLVSCKETSHLLSRMREEPLSGWAATKLRWHLAVCRMCAAFERQLRTLDEAMRRYRE